MNVKTRDVPAVNNKLRDNRSQVSSMLQLLMMTALRSTYCIRRI